MSYYRTSGESDPAVSSIMDQVMSSLNTVQRKLNEYYETAQNDGFNAADAIEEIRSIVSELVSGIQKIVS